MSWNKLVIQPINPSERITVQSGGPKQIRNKPGKSIAIIPRASKTNGQKGARTLTPIHITREIGIATGLALSQSRAIGRRLIFVRAMLGRSG
jgi:hypothetical protein